LYNKSLEQKEKQIWERKQRVKELLAKGKEVPKGQGTGEREQRMDQTKEEPLTHIDDEYAQAGLEDPRILITTSRDPSSKLAQFAKVSFVSLSFYGNFLSLEISTHNDLI
jgi:U3 small nucleolar ribonucleoprotein protein IMP4